MKIERVAILTKTAVTKASVHALATTIRPVPAGSESDPGLSAIKASAEQFTASVDPVESSDVDPLRRRILIARWWPRSV